MIRVVAVVVLTGVVLFAQSPGIRPRSSVADYPAHESASVAAFGAAVIPSGEAKKIFAADIEKAGYVVVEVGVFPAAGQDPDLSPTDFTLRADPNALSERTADSDAVAAAIAKPTPSPETLPGNVSVTADASVQHVSYPDPVTGRRTGGTIVDTGVGVGNRAPQYPTSSGTDTHRLEQSLWEKSLPDGRTTTPVAGYLYFPKPSKKAKGQAWVLEWQNAGERVNITLPR
jgi:hypothetical protein